MTTKQFNWLKNNQPIEVYWVDMYEVKEPKNFHHLRGVPDTQIIGERFYFAGKYYKFNGRNLIEHYARFSVHYKNIRRIRYRRTR
jgi:hypothetical protein